MSVSECSRSKPCTQTTIKATTWEGAETTYGQCADYEAIVVACRRYDVPLVEDAAEALGGTYQGRPAGVFGDLAIFSFNTNKIITTSGGGALVSDRKEWIEKARFLATQARDLRRTTSIPTSATTTG